jgi:AcrR family transcriptional regulator
MEGAPIDGRRARKTRETRQRIADAAVALFLQQGFDETTLDAIAEAADISRRTFFHYYPSKEAIVDALDDGLHEIFRAALTQAPADATPIRAIQTALKEVIGRYSGSEAMALHDLMYSTEGLRARKQASFARQEKALFEVMRELWPEPERSQGLRMASIVGIGAMRVAVDRWREATDKRSLLQQLDEAFDSLRSELREE